MEIKSGYQIWKLSRDIKWGHKIRTLSCSCGLVVMYQDYHACGPGSFPRKGKTYVGHPLRQKWVPEWTEKEIVSMLGNVHRKVAGAVAHKLGH